VAFLTVNGVDIPVAIASPPTLTYQEIGDRDDSSDGTHSAAIIGWKSSPKFTTPPMSQAAAATVRAALEAAPPVDATGDYFGGATVSVFPTVPNEKPIGTSPFTLQFDFALDEA
jgi:hypothetical protein